MKTIWVLLVLLFVIRYMADNWESIKKTVQSFKLWVLLVTVLVTMLGKIVVSIHAQLITKAHGRTFTFRESFWMYSASDLVKYVPGGLWNAVARVRLYSNMGMSATSSTKAFALEKYWMVVGAVAVGSIALTPEGLEALGFDTPATVEWIVRAALLGLWGVAMWAGGMFTGVNLPRNQVLISMVHEIAIAVFLGLGVWVPLEAVDAGISPLVAIGAFSIGRGVGYVAVFAPAGIGVREVVTLWALGGSSATSQAMVVALAVNRVMTFVADLSSFAVSLGVRPRSNGNNS